MYVFVHVNRYVCIHTYIISLSDRKNSKQMLGTDKALAPSAGLLSSYPPLRSSPANGILVQPRSAYTPPSRGFPASADLQVFNCTVLLYNVSLVSRAVFRILKVRRELQNCYLHKVASLVLVLHTLRIRLQRPRAVPAKQRDAKGHLTSPHDVCLCKAAKTR